MNNILRASRIVNKMVETAVFVMLGAMVLIVSAGVFWRYGLQFRSQLVRGAGAVPPRLDILSGRFHGHLSRGPHRHLHAHRPASRAASAGRRTLRQPDRPCLPGSCSLPGGKNPAGHGRARGSNIGSPNGGVLSGAADFCDGHDPSRHWRIDKHPF